MSCIKSRYKLDGSFYILVWYMYGLKVPICSNEAVDIAEHAVL